MSGFGAMTARLMGRPAFVAMGGVSGHGRFQPPTAPTSSTDMSLVDRLLDDARTPSAGPADVVDAGSDRFLPVTLRAALADEDAADERLDGLFKSANNTFAVIRPSVDTS